MDNALDYTPDGGEIKLFIKVKNNDVELMIKDSGPGISKADQVHIFERYMHGEKKGSTGLGLAIVKKILDLHEAPVKVISEPNQGTAFQFSLAVYNGELGWT